MTLIIVILWVSFPCCFYGSHRYVPCSLLTFLLSQSRLSIAGRPLQPRGTQPHTHTHPPTHTHTHTIDPASILFSHSVGSGGCCSWHNPNSCPKLLLMLPVCTLCDTFKHFS